VGVSKVGGIFVHKQEVGRFSEKSPKFVREVVMQELLARKRSFEDKQRPETVGQGQVEQRAEQALVTLDHFLGHLGLGPDPASARGMVNRNRAPSPACRASRSRA
jgi:hypothetical protein